MTDKQTQKALQQAFAVLAAAQKDRNLSPLLVSKAAKVKGTELGAAAAALDVAYEEFRTQVLFLAQEAEDPDYKGIAEEAGVNFATLDDLPIYI